MAPNLILKVSTNLLAFPERAEAGTARSRATLKQG